MSNSFAFANRSPDRSVNAAKVVRRNPMCGRKNVNAHEWSRCKCKYTRYDTINGWMDEGSLQMLFGLGGRSSKCREKKIRSRCYLFERTNSNSQVRDESFYQMRVLRICVQFIEPQNSRFIEFGRFVFTFDDGKFRRNWRKFKHFTDYWISLWKLPVRFTVPQSWRVDTVRLTQRTTHLSYWK